MNDATNRTGTAVAPPERLTVLTVDPTAHLTDEQKTWRKVKLAYAGSEGAFALVPADAPAPVPPGAQVLPAVADMLASGRAADAAGVFERLRAAGLALKAVVGADGVLHVTTVSA